MDEKWKLSKKGSRNYSRSKREQSAGAAAAASSSSSCASSSGSGSGAPYLKRSSSMPESVKSVRRPPPPGPSSSSGSASPRSFTSRCASLVKEQRAKFYIMRRCVTMLMCWRDYP